MKPADLQKILDQADPRWSLRPLLLALLKLWEARLSEQWRNDDDLTDAALRELEDLPR